MQKKITAVLLISLLFVFALSGCGAGGGASNNNSSSPPDQQSQGVSSIGSQSQAQPNQPATSAPTGEPMTITTYDYNAYEPRTDAVPDVPGASTKDGKVMIGLIQGLTGPSSFGCNEVLNGTSIAIEEQGTIWGKPIELMVGDAVEAAAVLSEYERMKAAGVKIFLGSFDSADMVLANYVDIDEVLLIQQCQWSVEVTTRGLNNLFQMPPNYYKFGDSLAVNTVELGKLCFDKDPADLKIAVIGNEGSADIISGYVRGLESRGAAPAFTEIYPANRSDFTSLISQLQAGDYDIVVPFNGSSDGPQVRRKMVEMDYEPPLFLACGMFYDSPDCALLGNDVTDGICTQSYTNPFMSPEFVPGLAEYRAKFEDRYGRSPITHALMAYSGTKTLLRMIDLIGEMPTAPLVEEFRKIDIPPGGTPAYWGVKFDEQGRNIRAGEPCVIGQWQNGEIIIAYPDYLATGELIVPWKKS